MKKTLMIGLTPPLEGGSERHIYEMSSRMPNVTVLTQRGSICPKKISLPILKKPTLIRNISFMLVSFLYSIVLILTPKKKYHLIHIHENLLYFLAPFLSSRYRLIITVHGIRGFSFYDNPALWKIFKQFLKFADVLVAVNKEDQKALKKEFDKVIYLPNGVDLSCYEKINPPVEKKIVFIGRIHEQKGIIYLLQAFEEFSKKHPQWDLEIIGEINSYAKILQTKFNNPHILWKGYLGNRNEIVKSLKSAYCIILPSLWEGLPLTLFESLASGRPVVLSDIPAFKSVIKDESIFFKSKDSSDLRKKIDSITENVKRAEMLGQKGLSLSKRYDWTSIVSQLQREYEKH